MGSVYRQAYRLGLHGQPRPDGHESSAIRWRVLATDEAGVVRVDVDTGNGFRAATVAETDRALRQLRVCTSSQTGRILSQPR